MFHDKSLPHEPIGELCERCRSQVDALWDVWGHQICSACVGEWSEASDVVVPPEPLWKATRRGATWDEIHADGQRYAGEMQRFTDEWVKRGKEQAA